MTAYYNEHDPKAAAWLRQLIKEGLIASGDVDDRSITEVRASDLVGYTQCHFFAGIGVWSAALRGAGWGDSRSVWTGSCPCQPFSASGKQAGFEDARHLWPVWFELIRECRPRVVFGEQVASPLGRQWFDAVSSDLERMDYACGPADLCAASIGAPHIRQRLYFVADAANERRDRRRDSETRDGGDAPRVEPERLRDADGLANADAPGRRLERCEGLPTECDASLRHDADRCGAAVRLDDTVVVGRRSLGHNHAGDDGRLVGAANAVGGLADAAISGRREECADGGRGDVGDRTQGRGAGSLTSGDDLRPSATNGFWRAADWLACTDGKWRAVEPGTFPLAHGATARVGRLRGYGNAIVKPLAEAFIGAYLDLGRLSR